MRYVAVLAMLLVASSAKAQGFVIHVPLQCDTTEALINLLKDRWKEVPIGGGLSRDEHVRLFTSHNAGDKQTWTLIVSNVNGFSCLIRGGEDWIVEPPVKKGDPS